jgi:hypothetical protein
MYSEPRCNGKARDRFFFFFADRSSFIRLFEVWILEIPHHRDSENISAKDKFPLFPISRNNALCTFMQEIAISNPCTVTGYLKWGFSFIVLFLPVCAGKVPRFYRVRFFSPTLQFIIL